MSQNLFEFSLFSENIYDLIDQCILHIDNIIFIEQFKRKFETNILKPLHNNNNRGQNSRTPLLRLVELDKTRREKNRFLRDLIALSSNIIQISQQEILQDTFEQPNESSFIYSLLFDDWSQALTIHQTIVDQLIGQLVFWKEQGLRGGEISKWKNYSSDESGVAHRIWNYICQRADQAFQLDQFIKDEFERMNVKFRLKDEITLCVSTYCNNASDQRTYFQYLEDMDQKFENEIVRSIDVPEEIGALVPYITRLNVFSESTVWLKFYKQRCENSSSIDCSGKIMTTDTNENHQPTCSALLMQAGQIFDLFVEELKSICENWPTFPISQLIQLFPESNYIDHDLKMLEQLLNITTTIPILKEILDFWNSHSHTHHICQGFIYLTHYLQIPNSSKGSILRRMLNINDKTLGDNFYQTYQKFNQQYSKRYPLDVLNIIAHYSSSNDLIKFLHQLTANDANNLLEAVNDWDESLINTKTVLDFVLIKTFLDRVYVRIGLILQEQSTTTTTFEFNQIIDCFQSVLNEKEFENILLCFESCSMLLYSIQRVHLDLTDKEQSKRQRILEIMQKSSFSFVNKSMETLDLVEYHFDVNTDIRPTTFADLCELRDRARLIEHSKNEIKNDSNKEIDDLHLFVSLVDLIEVILKSLTLLHISGHPYVSDPFTPCKEFQCIARDRQQLEKFSRNLEKLLIKWEQHLCTMYERYLDLTYFSFDQIWLVEHYLYNQKTRSKTDPGYHLLKFIDLQPDSFKVNNPIEEKETTYQRLEKVGKILNTQHQNPPIDMRTKLIKNIILIETSEDGVMRAILSFFNLTEIHGTAKQLFYCTEKTSWIEIRAFVYRCFYSRTLQQLIRPQLLTSLIQSQMIELIRQLMKNSSQPSFQLAIIATVPVIHIPLINGLKVLEILHTYLDQDLPDLSQFKKMIQPYLGKNIFMVKSRISGLGKSTFIRDSIRQTNKKYIKFPINGDIHIDIIAKHLSKYADQLDSSTFAIHIDIGTIDNIRQLNEFLYCLLLFRNFRLGQVAVHLPVDVPTYIELDSSPDAINLYKKILIFTYLEPSIQIDDMNWNKLEPSKLVGVQWVVNYLDAIDNKTVNDNDINETTIKSMKDEISSRLLRHHILQGKNEEFLTWTKVSIFVAVYSSLFKGFSRCGHFLISSVKWLEVPQLRIDILSSLLNSSDQFTSLSVEVVRKKQRSEEDLNSVDLTEAIIRWDKSQAFTLVFTDTDDPIFVYKKTEDIPKSLIAALNSRPRSILGRYNLTKSSQSSVYSSFFPDYAKLTHAQFFAKLASLSKKYFNKSICLKCFSQHEYAEQQCQKCPTHDSLVRPSSYNQEDCAKFQKMISDKLQYEYVLTPDNYIKMLLIYLRVQSDLPVLIMGETG